MKKKEQLVQELKDELEALRKGWRMGYADPKNWEVFVIDKLADIYGQLEQLSAHNAPKGTLGFD